MISAAFVVVSPVGCLRVSGVVNHFGSLQHPQIQKKTSKFIRYLCAENKAALDQWIMGIRIAKVSISSLSHKQKIFFSHLQLAEGRCKYQFSGVLILISCGGIKFASGLVVKFCFMTISREARRCILQTLV